MLPKLAPTSQRLFLLDGIGALITALFLSLILAQFPATFGMPPRVLYGLAGLAGIFALYSLTCYRITPHRWALWLTLIALANLSYCVLTAGLLHYYYAQLTSWGLAYFAGEILIIASLAFVELSVARSGG